MSKKAIHIIEEVAARRKGALVGYISINSFVKFYTEGRIFTNRCSSAQALALAHFIVTEMNTGNTIDLSPTGAMGKFTKEYFNTTGASIRYTRVRDHVNTLTKCKILIRLARGKYMINPFYAWKGDEKERVDTIHRLISNGFKLTFIGTENGRD